MSAVSTTREDVEALAKRFAARWRDIDPDGESEVSATLRALLAERDALTAEAAVHLRYRTIAETERDAARAECEAHKARADRYDTEAACASILRAEVERMREALSTAERRLESGALRIAELGDARAAYGLKEWAADARAALTGAPRHD